MFLHLIFCSFFYYRKRIFRPIKKKKGSFGLLSLFLCQRRLRGRVFVVVYGLVQCELDCEKSESVYLLRCARASRKESV